LTVAPLILETKNFSEITDSENIYMIMCSNTIFYSRDFGNGKSRFERGRYDRFDTAIFREKFLYSKLLTKKYEWHLSAGIGYYFPNLNIQFGGRIRRHDIFHVLSDYEINFLDGLQRLQYSLFR